MLGYRLMNRFCMMLIIIGLSTITILPFSVCAEDIFPKPGWQDEEERAGKRHLGAVV